LDTLITEVIPLKIIIIATLLYKDISIIY